MTIILLQAVLDTCGPATYLPAPLLLPFLCRCLSRVARGLALIPGVVMGLRGG